MAARGRFDRRQRRETAAAGPGSPGVPSLEVCPRAPQPALAVGAGMGARRRRRSERPPSSPRRLCTKRTAPKIPKFAQTAIDFRSALSSGGGEMGWRGPEGDGARRRRRELALLCLFLHKLADGVGNLPAWPCACCGAPRSVRASSTPAACRAPQLSLRGGAPRSAGRQRVASSPSPSPPLPSDSDAVMHEVANTGPLSQAQTTQLQALPLSELLPLCEACGIAKVGGAKAECAPAPELAHALGRLDGQRREFLKEALCELAASAPPETADTPAREQAEASRRDSPRRPAATKPVAAVGREQKASGPKPASALKPGFLLQGSTRYTRGAGAGGGAANVPVVGESDVSYRDHSAVQRPGRIQQARTSSRVRRKTPHSSV
ncbi:MAG: hypothetical protein ACPIOQ_09920, partial [Promethearchaeia archaeon]